MKQNSAPVVTCPHCKKTSQWDTQNPFRPFCCERCKIIDLGKWANEEYRVAKPFDEQDFLDEPTVPVLFRS